MEIGKRQFVNRKSETGKRKSVIGNWEMVNSFFCPLFPFAFRLLPLACHCPLTAVPFRLSPFRPWPYAYIRPEPCALSLTPTIAFFLCGFAALKILHAHLFEFFQSRKNHIIGYSHLFSNPSETVLSVFFSEMDHGKEIIFPFERRRPFITVGNFSV